MFNELSAENKKQIIEWLQQDAVQVVMVEIDVGEIRPKQLGKTGYVLLTVVDKDVVPKKEDEEKSATDPRTVTGLVNSLIQGSQG